MSYLFISILQWQNTDLELPRWTLLLPSTGPCYPQSSKHLLFHPISKIKKLVWAQMTSITSARSWREQSQTFWQIWLQRTSQHENFHISILILLDISAALTQTPLQILDITLKFCSWNLHSCLIISRLDYGNSIPFVLHLKSLDMLQYVQKSAIGSYMQ